MPRFRSTLAVMGFCGACRALPSAIPLADTGEGHFVEDGALGRNRVALTERGSGDESYDESSGMDETVIVAASSPDAGDAGVPEGGTAMASASDSGKGWAGDYFGSDKQVTRLEGKSEKVDLDDKAHTRVDEPSTGIVLISLVSSGNGEVICGMRARVTGNRAELEPGESCPNLMVMPPLAIKGSATLDGDELVFDVEAHGEFPSDDEALSVDVDYHFAGKRR